MIARNITTRDFIWQNIMILYNRWLKYHSHFAICAAQQSHLISHTISVDTEGEKSVKYSGHMISNIVARIALYRDAGKKKFN